MRGEWFLPSFSDSTFFNTVLCGISVKDQDPSLPLLLTKLPKKIKLKKNYVDIFQIIINIVIPTHIPIYILFTYI